MVNKKEMERAIYRGCENVLIEVKETQELIKNLRKRIQELESENKTIEIDCPECKRVTLAKKLPYLATSCSPVNMDFRDKMYCYSCGKTFVKKDTWEAVND